MNKLKFMRLGLVLAFLAITLCPPTSWRTTKAQTSVNQNETIAFIGVSVIPMDKERVLKNQTVFIRSGRIAEIGDESKIKIPTEALRIDGRGKFLMPGIVDMHLHLPPGEGANNDLPSQQLRLLLANGVTTGRNMIGSPTNLVLRDKINKGEITGPQIFTAGPPLHGNNTSSVEAAVKVVNDQKKAGYDLLKVHEGLKPEVYDAIAKTAREVGIQFAGHVTFSVGLKRALAAKQTSIEHLDNYLQAAVVAPDANFEITPSQVVLGDTLKYIDEKKLAELARETKSSNVANNPTLTLFKLVVSDNKPEEYLKWEEMQYIPAKMRENFAKQKAGTLNIPGSLEEKKRYIEMRNLLIRELYKAGAKIIVGPDSPQFFLVPGFATHREMQSLAEAGLSNYAVLEAATRNGAENLGMLKEFGTIEKGKRADLLLLDANPLDSIGNARRIAGVMVRGKWLSKTDLQKMLEDVAALHR
ncbi:MAG TPA: amidohydrolase family protein [Pyrinomonadaceae bacterium]|nr:amidohydrolase family protein [Pyrinomonadaceae bacterium]